MIPGGELESFIGKHGKLIRAVVFQTAVWCGVIFILKLSFL